MTQRECECEQRPKFEWTLVHFKAVSITWSKLAAIYSCYITARSARGWSFRTEHNLHRFQVAVAIVLLSLAYDGLVPSFIHVRINHPPSDR